MKKTAAALAVAGLILSAGVAGHQAGAQEAESEVAAPALVGTPPSQFVGVTPYRTFDSRDSERLGAGGTEGVSFDPSFDREGTLQIPRGATAVAYNIAAFQTGGTGFLTVYPCFDSQPDVAAVNWSGVAQVSNSAGIIAPSIEAREEVTSCLFAVIGGSGDATTHFTVDITGYFE